MWFSIIFHKPAPKLLDIKQSGGGITNEGRKEVISMTIIYFIAVNMSPSNFIVYFLHILVLPGHGNSKLL